jgi:hypothetical protein
MGLGQEGTRAPGHGKAKFAQEAAGRWVLEEEGLEAPVPPGLRSAFMRVSL